MPFRVLNAKETLFSFVQDHGQKGGKVSKGSLFHFPDSVFWLVCLWESAGFLGHRYLLINQLLDRVLLDPFPVRGFTICHGTAQKQLSMVWLLGLELREHCAGSAVPAGPASKTSTPFTVVV